MAYSKSRPSASSYDIKLLLLRTSEHIIFTAGEGMKGDEGNALLAWGSKIEAFDAMIGIYYEDDPGYQANKKRFQKLTLHTQPTTMANRMKLQRVYALWFGMICQKLRKFGIYPPISSGYVQGFGTRMESGMLEEH